MASLSTQFGVNLALVREIVFRESGGRPTAQNKTSTAYGLCQFLNTTWVYIQKKWSMELVRESPRDQLYACVRLLSEEGISHWSASGPYNTGSSP
mgnify:FL=1